MSKLNANYLLPLLFSIFSIISFKSQGQNVLEFEETELEYFETYTYLVESFQDMFGAEAGSIVPTQEDIDALGSESEIYIFREEHIKQGSRVELKKSLVWIQRIGTRVIITERWTWSFWLTCSEYNRFVELHNRSAVANILNGMCTTQTCLDNLVGLMFPYLETGVGGLKYYYLCDFFYQGVFFKMENWIAGGETYTIFWYNQGGWQIALSLPYSPGIETYCDYEGTTRSSEESDEVLAKLAEVISTLSIEENTISYEFKSYPNPASSELNFETNANVQQIMLFDLSGKVIKDFTIESGIQQGTLSLDDVASGTYILKAMTADKVFDNKITIQK